MIYPFSLRAVGLVVALALIGAHAFALFAPRTVKPLLVAFPRSRVAGTILLAISAVWTFWLISTMDLGEFARLRNILQIAVPVGAILAWFFVDEFLAVRSLGILALLAAAPLIESAFLRPELSRLLLVTLAYVWILVGLFLVGMPFLLRDLLTWILLAPARYSAATIAGLAYGAALLVCALAFWK